MATVFACLYLLGTVLGGIGLGWTALHPGRRPISDDQKVEVIANAGAGAQLSDVSIAAADGAILRGWQIRPSAVNGNVVLLLHGVGDNRLGVAGYADWLARNHYTVVLPDSRAHGYSGGAIASYGLMESDDIHRWVEWIAENEHPRCVYGFGESMGAAEILESLAKEDRYCAIVAECPFATFREVAYARFGRPFNLGPWLGKTFFWPTVEVGFWYVHYKFALNMNQASPADAVARAHVPIFLLHGLSDRNIPSSQSVEIQAHNPEMISLWRVAGAGHCGTHSVVPEQFEQKVLGWFVEHPSPKQSCGRVGNKLITKLLPH